MTIRPVENGDLEMILALERETFIDPWTKEHFLYEINENPYALVMLAEQDGQLLGYYDIWIMFEQATLNQIAVDERYRHRGIGTMMFDDIIKRLALTEATQLTLEVRTGNTVAQHFYMKHGFTILLKKEKYYTNGEDAYYMVKQL